MRITRELIEKRIDAIEKEWGFTNKTGYAQVPFLAEAHSKKWDGEYKETLKIAYIEYGKREALQSLLNN